MAREYRQSRPRCRQTRSMGRAPGGGRTRLRPPGRRYQARPPEPSLLCASCQPEAVIAAARGRRKDPRRGYPIGADGNAMQARSRCSPTTRDAPTPLPSDLPPPIAACPYCATESVSVSPAQVMGDGVTPLEQQWHLAEPAQEVSAPDDLVLRHRQPELRVAPDQRLEGDLPLDPGQRRS